MNPTINNAIKEKKLLTFSYKGVLRTVEPHTFGMDKKNNLVLSAWQLKGKPGDTPDWRLYLHGNIIFLQALSTTFQGARPGYVRNDSRMMTIYAQL